MIKFKDLSGWLKLAVITAWAEFIVWVFSFLYGFMYGLGL